MSNLIEMKTVRIGSTTYEIVDAKARKLLEQGGGSGGSGGSGKDGFSPTISVSVINGGHRLTITDANGTKTVDVMDGADGADGKTPKRGTDYWTETDIAEIKAYVDEAILGGEW